MLNIFKKFMKNNKKEEGQTVSEMNVVELKELVVSLGLKTEAEVKSLKKNELEKIISKWEKKSLKELEAKEKAFDEAIDGVTPVAEVDTYRGKKVISRTGIELGGKKYEDILVETGETFRNLIS